MTRFKVTIVEQQDVAAVEQALAQMSGTVESVVIESRRGLSTARNTGLAVTSGDVVGFPDDDCWYEPETLAMVASAFEDASIDFVIGRQVDSAGAEVLRSPAENCAVNRDNVWRLAMSSAVFVRRRLIEVIGGFDGTLGVGASSPYQSGEETDLILRAIRAGFRGTYLHDLVVRHPAPSETPGRQLPAVARGYGRGMGRVLQLNGYGVIRTIPFVVRPLAGSVIAMTRSQFLLARFRFAAACGRWEGYWWSRKAARIGVNDLRITDGTGGD